MARQADSSDLPPLGPHLLRSLNWTFLLIPEKCPYLLDQRNKNKQAISWEHI